MRTVHRNNKNVCVLNNFIFVCLDLFVTVLIIIIKKNSLKQKYLHVVAKEDPQARTVGGRAVYDGSQL